MGDIFRIRENNSLYGGNNIKGLEKER